jgi:putative chitinase
MLTLEKIKKSFPNAKDEIVNAILTSQDKLKTKYGIDTPLELAHFLGQTAHESGGFRVIEENLNYSAVGLQKIFPKYFKDVDPNLYARKPEKIANRVYASRMGNGPESSGDGWKYRGRGLIQLTGKDNYSAMAKDMDLPIDRVVEYLTSPIGAVESAAWFWSKNGLNTLAAKDDIVAVTKRINGGTNGIDDRKHHTAIFKDLLGVK